jgi:hypothetical protein
MDLKFDEIAVSVPLSEAITYRLESQLVSEEHFEDFRSYWTEVINGRAGKHYIQHSMCVDADMGDSISALLLLSRTTSLPLVPKLIPKKKIKRCIRIPNNGPVYFIVEKALLDEILGERSFVLFMLVDAEDIVDKYKSEGRIERAAIDGLISDLDALSESHPDFSFLSFADSVLVKKVWRPFEMGSGFAPESLIKLYAPIRDIFAKRLGAPSYATVTLGYDEFPDGKPLHISKTSGHVSLKAFGTPFARLHEIEFAARKHCRDGKHPRCSVYLDGVLFFSLAIDYKYRQSKYGKSQVQFESKLIPRSVSSYFFLDYEELIGKFMDRKTDEEREKDRERKRAAFSE